MLPIVANVFNLLDGSHLIVLAIVGLLLFGKDLPVMARRAAKEYFRFKRMISDATSDIRREMESAADQIEEEKRKIQSEVNTSMDSLNTIADTASSNGSSSNGSNGTNGASVEANGNGTVYPYGDTPESPRISQPPPKPAADPLALDVPTPSTHRATEPARSPAASVAQLDAFQKSVPPPGKIPPSVG